MISIPRRLQTFIAAAFISFASPAGATEILFAHVGNGAYEADGNQLAGYVNSISGFNVTTRFLNSAVYSDYDQFDQIWVYDLSTGLDNTTTQRANYNRIASWYAGKGSPDIIADGRILGSTSSWTGRSNGTGQSEEAWIQNYATQLDLRGGGLVLGTDHATAWTDGINDINSRIGINPFTNRWFQAPYRSVVREDSQLYVDGLISCDVIPGGDPEHCLNDNSSTSDAPFNLQPNGSILYPVAFHGGDVNRVSISTTITGPPPEPPMGIAEPATFALLGLGVAGLMSARRKRAA